MSGAQFPDALPEGVITLENTKEVAARIVLDFLDPKAPDVACHVAAHVAGTVLGWATTDGVGIKLARYGATVGVIAASVATVPPAEQPAVVREMIDALGILLMQMEAAVARNRGQTPRLH